MKFNRKKNQKDLVLFTYFFNVMKTFLIRKSYRFILHTIVSVKFLRQKPTKKKFIIFNSLGNIVFLTCH